MNAVVSEAAERDRDIAQMLRTDGRDRAFGALLPRYESKVYRLCCTLLRDRALAEDVAQESLIRVWQALDRYDGRAALSSWIYAITRNRCLSALEKRRAAGALAEVAEDMGSEPTTVEPVSPGGRTERLLDLVERLPERLRRPLVLYYYEERSVSEVALMLGCAQGTVKTALFRARAALGKSLKRQGLHDPAYWRED